MKKLFSIIFAVIILGTVFMLPASAEDDGTLRLEVVDVDVYDSGSFQSMHDGEVTVRGNYYNHTGYIVSFGDSVWVKTTEGECYVKAYISSLDDGEGAFSFRMDDIEGEVLKIEIPKIEIANAGEDIKKEHIVIYDVERGISDCTIEFDIPDEENNDSAGIIAVLFVLSPFILAALAFIIIIIFIIWLARYLNKKSEPGTVTFTSYAAQDNDPQNINGTNFQQK